MTWCSLNCGIFDLDTDEASMSNGSIGFILNEVLGRNRSEKSHNKLVLGNTRVLSIILLLYDSLQVLCSKQSNTAQSDGDAFGHDC